MIKIFLIPAIIIGLVSSTLFSATSLAIDSCNENSTRICQTDSTTLANDVIKPVINILLTVAGMIAVLMIVIGGIRYITSDGDSNRASQAKNTILYALIGLIVAVSSYAIVNFVLGRI